MRQNDISNCSRGIEIKHNIISTTNCTRYYQEAISQGSVQRLSKLENTIKVGPEHKVGLTVTHSKSYLLTKRTSDE
jgi:hypothetical protein